MVSAQGFLNKVKNKLANSAEKSATNTANSNVAAANQVAPSSHNYTDPAKFGTLIYTFSKTEMAAHGGADGYGFNMWFPNLAVVNNQLVFQVADHDAALYTYSGGQLQLIGGKPDLSMQNTLLTGSEKDQWSVDFTQTDQANAMLKKGPHIASGMIAGKPEQTYIFNGKNIGNFVMAAVAHNADSSVVTVVGASLNGGMNYKMVSSNGQQIALPKQFGGRALVSSDGKISAALYLNKTGDGYDVYSITGAQISIGNFNNGLGWLRNTGSVFNVEINNPKALDMNGKLYFTFDVPVEPKSLYINSDDKRVCWMGDHGLFFSDGTAFENGQSPRKVILDNKEVIVFLDTDTQSGKLYLCKHDL